MTDIEFIIQELDPAQVLRNTGRATDILSTSLFAKLDSLLPNQSTYVTLDLFSSQVKSGQQVYVSRFLKKLHERIKNQEGVAEFMYRYYDPKPEATDEHEKLGFIRIWRIK